MGTAFFSTDPLSFSTHWPGHAVFGPGSVRRIGGLLRQQAAQRVMLVTDRGIVESGLLEPLLSDLHAEGLHTSVFDGVSPNPGMANVDAALAQWQLDDADAVLAIGGGSSIDTAKILVARLCSDAPFDQLLAGGDALMTRSAPPFIAVPTTAGTGSESTLAALIKDEAGRKRVFRSQRNQPEWVVLDPELTLSVPRAVTAATGFDVVMHALGAATNRATHPIGEALAQRALASAVNWLPRVLAQPGSIEARSEMLLASYLAGVAISLKGVDAIHGLCTPLESLVTQPHGHVLSVVYEPVMRFNLHTEAARYAALARACGWSQPGQPEPEAALEVHQRIAALRDALGLPARLADIGVRSDALPSLLDAAHTGPSTRLNARSLSRDDVQALYDAMNNTLNQETTP